MSKITEFVAIGRRKTATARVRLSKGKGVWMINDKKIDINHLSDDVKTSLLKPFQVIGDEEGFDFRARVNGGGFMGQIEAIVLGISRALEKMNAEWRGALKNASLLTCDGRIKERKKPGRPGARKRFQFSKR